eukprot:545257_1
MDPCIKGPLSTTTDYTVAMQFCNNQGMILEMSISTLVWWMSCFEGKDTMGRITCVDISWFSDFVNEQEVFCIGGLHNIYYVNIIEAPTGNSYIAYIAGLRILTQKLLAETTVDKDASWSYTPTIYAKEVAFRLLSNELYRYIPSHPAVKQCTSIPEYIRNLLHSHYINVWKIIIEPKRDIMNYFFIEKSVGWVKLDLLVIVFPKLQSIHFDAYDKSGTWLTQSSIYESILYFISKGVNGSLEEIMIEYNSQYHYVMETFIEKYKHRFKEYEWCIDLNHQHYENMLNIKDESKYESALKKLVLNPENKLNLWSVTIRKCNLDPKTQQSICTTKTSKRTHFFSLPCKSCCICEFSV